ncbi:MAG: hypothetical protein KIG81_01435 [Thermoguttaceae bacterium]|nr:hypothetical protein [Thermoguttaceae bacterium]
MSSSPIESVAPWEEAEEVAPIAELSEFSDFTPPEASDGLDDDAPIPPEKEPLIDEIASEFVGFWNVLVSKTNWEKGKVVHSWRTKLQEAGLPRRIYSDEAIAQRIGGVSPQHVGRLRRVYERCGAEPPLPNLYWSHYQAALDWDDADEWLQRASQEKLSVAQTRVARWEKYGPTLQTPPRDDADADVVEDEDVNPFDDSNAPISGKPTETTKEKDDDLEPKKAAKKKSKKDDSAALGEFSGETEPWETEDRPKILTASVLSELGALDELPADLMEAIEALKVAILTRKVENWSDVTPVLVASYLSSLKKLLVAEDA